MLRDHDQEGRPGHRRTRAPRTPTSPTWTTDFPVDPEVDAVVFLEAYDNEAIMTKIPEVSCPEVDKSKWENSEIDQKKNKISSYYLKCF